MQSKEEKNYIVKTNDNNLITIIQNHKKTTYIRYKIYMTFRISLEKIGTDITYLDLSMNKKAGYPLFYIHGLLGYTFQENYKEENEWIFP